MVTLLRSQLLGQTSFVRPFFEGGIDEIIATRRLVHIVNAYGIFGDRKKAIEMCIARFDEDTKTSFLDLYSKCDSEVVVTEESTEITDGFEKTSTDTEETEDNLNPF